MVELVEPLSKHQLPLLRVNARFSDRGPCDAELATDSEIPQRRYFGFLHNVAKFFHFAILYRPTI